MTGKIQHWLVGILMVAPAILLRSSEAKSIHVVGDSMGWTIPPASTAYATWAATKTFAVGDILVFNFENGLHDVAEVTKPDYSACNSASPKWIKTAGPANITLSSPGQHLFICTFGGHCNLGQKLAINVLAAPPISPTTRAASTRGPVTYTVGDSMSWRVPPGGAAAYQAWANSKTFFAGDILVFNFINGTHDVAEVTEASYNSCNTATAVALWSNPPVRVTLTAPGPHFFTCTVPGHCSSGQKLAITVTASPAAAPAPALPPPPETAIPPPSNSPALPPPSAFTATPPPAVSSPPPSNYVAPSPIKEATPPPSSTANPPTASASPTPSVHSPAGALGGPSPSPKTSGNNAAASLTSIGFSTNAVLAQVAAVLAAEFVRQLFS